MIDKPTIDRIMEAARIEDVIGEFVSLKKRGGNHIGCCPFHNEKTPSFYVSPSKGIYKCFGCGESGNVVGFLMKHEHYTYPEALKWLAKKYNIIVEEEPLTEEQREQQTERDNLFHASEFAQKYFADLLYNDDLGRAIGLAYFHERGLSDVIIKRFGLGYCKDSWTDFTDHALSNGYSLDVLDKTGLTIVKEGGKKYDRFRGRVMFPIFSISGRVIGFSGRVLTKDKQAAKYVNSPESEIYDKSNALYGIFQARSAIGRADHCYLVEGNVDVISMHQAGVENTVASCGTSLTPQQIRIIKRYTNNVTVLYDGDSAGIKATLKAVNLLFAEGMHVRTTLFSDGDDPDSYAQKYGSEQLQRYLKEHSENFLMYRARIVGDEIKNDPTRKVAYIAEIVNSLALVVDRQEQAEYIKQCAYLFKTSEELLSDMVRKAMITARQKLMQEQQREAAQQQGTTGGQPVMPGQGQPPTVQPMQGQSVQTVGGQAVQPGVSPMQPPPMPEGFVAPPDDLFLPDNGGYVAPRQELPSLNPAEAQEAQIARLLVRNGSSDIEVTIDETSAVTRVADWIVANLEDEISFENPLYRSIFELYAQRVREEKPLPDANYFAQSSDLPLRNFALEQMLEPYTISPLWETSKGIITVMPEMRLRMDVEESINSLLTKKIELKIVDLRRRLNDAKEESEMSELLEEVARLQEAKHKIEREKLHRVIGC